MEWPDKLRLEVQDPVGSMLALLIVNGDRFWLYQQDRKENLTGPLSRLPGVVLPAMSPQDLLRIFLARPDLAPFAAGVRGDSSATAQVKDGRQALSWQGNLLTKWEFMAAGGASSSVEYQGYEFRSGAHYPSKIHLERKAPGQQEESVLLLWNDWEASVPKEKKLFHLPPQQQFGRPTKALP